jgi:hypothetical protein
MPGRVADQEVDEEEVVTFKQVEMWYVVFCGEPAEIRAARAR